MCSAVVLFNMNLSSKFKANVLHGYWDTESPPDDKDAIPASWQAQKQEPEHTKSMM